jgi:AraC-like DNA-binding protein
MPEGHLSPTLVNDDTFRRLCRARDLIAEQYQSQILPEAAAREACLSPFHFHRLFRSKFQNLAGVPPTQYQREIRLVFASSGHGRSCWCLPAISPLTARNARLQPPQ